MGSILKNTTIISLGTNLSRILGLIRDVVIAGLFGTGYGAGAFVVAFTLPNMLRDFVGEGAANSAFVPVLTEYKVKKGDKEFWQTASTLLNILFIALVILSLLGILLAPVLVRVMAPGFVKEAGAITLTVKLTRVIFPYIFFMGLMAYFMGVLNTLGHFTAPAFGHCLLNISLITSAVVLCDEMGPMGLAIGVLAGGILQVAIQIPVMVKKGFKWVFNFRLSHPAVKKVGLLLAPRLLGTAVYHVNILVDKMLASLSWIVGYGGIPALYFSYRLIQYPLGIFSTALSTAVLPVMSRHAVKDDIAKLRDTVSFSLRGIFFIMIPASVGLAVLGRYIIGIIFQRGAFTGYSTDITYTALLFYSIGLFAYGGIRILATTFYSMNDTRTPVKVAALALLINVCFNLILMYPLKIGGLALATSIAAIVNFSVLFIILRKRLNGLEDRRIFSALYKVVIACVPMGIICDTMAKTLLPDPSNAGTLYKVLTLIGIVACGAGTFFLMSLALKMDEAGKIKKWILRRN